MIPQIFLYLCLFFVLTVQSQDGGDDGKGDAYFGRIVFLKTYTKPTQYQLATLEAVDNGVYSEVEGFSRDINQYDVHTIMYFGSKTYYLNLYSNAPTKEDTDTRILLYIENRLHSCLQYETTAEDTHMNSVVFSSTVVPFFVAQLQTYYLRDLGDQSWLADDDASHWIPVSVLTQLQYPHLRYYKYEFPLDPLAYHHSLVMIGIFMEQQFSLYINQHLVYTKLTTQDDNMHYLVFPSIYYLHSNSSNVVAFAVDTTNNNNLRYEFGVNMIESTRSVFPCSGKVTLTYPTFVESEENQNLIDMLPYTSFTLTVGPQNHTDFLITNDNIEFVNEYTIHISPTSSHFPKQWAFYGSMNRVDWTMLDKRMEEVEWFSFKQQYSLFSLSAPFLFFKFEFINDSEETESYTIVDIDLKGSPPSSIYPLYYHTEAQNLVNEHNNYFEFLLSPTQSFLLYPSLYPIVNDTSISLKLVENDAFPKDEISISSEGLITGHCSVYGNHTFTVSFQSMTGPLSTQITLFCDIPKYQLVKRRKNSVDSIPSNGYFDNSKFYSLCISIESGYISTHQLILTDEFSHEILTIPIYKKTYNNKNCVLLQPQIYHLHKVLLKKDYDQQDDQPVQYSITYDSILIHTGTFHPGARMFIAFDLSNYIQPLYFDDLPSANFETVPDNYTIPATPSSMVVLPRNTSLFTLGDRVGIIYSYDITTHLSPSDQAIHYNGAIHIVTEPTSERYLVYINNQLVINKKDTILTSYQYKMVFGETRFIDKYSIMFVHIGNQPFTFPQIYVFFTIEGSLNIANQYHVDSILMIPTAARSPIPSTPRNISSIPRHIRGDKILSANYEWSIPESEYYRINYLDIVYMIDNTDPSCYYTYALTCVLSPDHSQSVTGLLKNKMEDVPYFTVSRYFSSPLSPKRIHFVITASQRCTSIPLRFLYLDAGYVTYLNHTIVSQSMVIPYYPNHSIIPTPLSPSSHPYDCVDAIVIPSLPSTMHYNDKTSILYGSFDESAPPTSFVQCFSFNGVSTSYLMSFLALPSSSTAQDFTCYWSFPYASSTVTVTNQNYRILKQVSTIYQSSSSFTLHMESFTISLDLSDYGSISSSFFYCRVPLFEQPIDLFSELMSNKQITFSYQIHVTSSSHCHYYTSKEPLTSNWYDITADIDRPSTNTFVPWEYIPISEIHSPYAYHYLYFDLNLIDAHNGILTNDLLSIQYPLCSKTTIYLDGFLIHQEVLATSDETPSCTYKKLVFFAHSYFPESVIHYVHLSIEQKVNQTLSWNSFQITTLNSASLEPKTSMNFLSSTFSIFQEAKSVLFQYTIPPNYHEYLSYNAYTIILPTSIISSTYHYAIFIYGYSLNEEGKLQSTLLSSHIDAQFEEASNTFFFSNAPNFAYASYTASIYLYSYDMNDNVLMNAFSITPPILFLTIHSSDVFCRLDSIDHYYPSYETQTQPHDCNYGYSGKSYVLCLRHSFHTQNGSCHLNQPTNCEVNNFVFDHGSFIFSLKYEGIVSDCTIKQSLNEFQCSLEQLSITSRSLHDEKIDIILSNDAGSCSYSLSLSDYVERKNKYIIYIVVIGVLVVLILLSLFIYCYVKYRGSKNTKQKTFRFHTEVPSTCMNAIEMQPNIHEKSSDTSEYQPPAVTPSTSTNKLTSSHRKNEFPSVSSAPSSKKPNKVRIVASNYDYLFTMQPTATMGITPTRPSYMENSSLKKDIIPVTKTNSDSYLVDSSQSVSHLFVPSSSLERDIFPQSSTSFLTPISSDSLYSTNSKVSNHYGDGSVLPPQITIPSLRSSSSLSSTSYSLPPLSNLVFHSKGPSDTTSDSLYTSPDDFNDEH